MRGIPLFGEESLDAKSACKFESPFRETRHQTGKRWCLLKLPINARMRIC